jgi:hypothetical protein
MIPVIQNFKIVFPIYYFEFCIAVQIVEAFGQNGLFIGIPPYFKSKE